MFLVKRCVDVYLLNRCVCTYGRCVLIEEMCMHVRVLVSFIHVLCCIVLQGAFLCCPQSSTTCGLEALTHADIHVY